MRCSCVRTLLQRIVFVACAAGVARPVHAQEPQRATTRDIARAQVLDREGAKAYESGRFNDAIRYFEEAYRLGGPPFELWNIAKCHLRLDQPEQAAEMLERYLATPNLPPEDQKEAMQQLEELRSRESTLTISSEPPGAEVQIDGRTPPIANGRTPLSVNVPPGPHTVTLSFGSRGTVTRQVEARYGRAIIVDATPNHDTPPPPDNPYKEPDKEEDYGKDRRVAFRAAIGPMIPRHGTVASDTAFGFLLSGSYRVGGAAGGTSFHLGGLLTVNEDSWHNNVGATMSPPSCQGRTLRDPFSATAVSILATGAAGFEIVPRLRASALAGVGVAAYAVDDVGGDVFVASCTTEPGARPTFMLGAQIDWALTPAFRLSAFPVAMQLQPSFTGVREQPRDASGLWMRTMIGIGVGIDL